MLLNLSNYLNLLFQINNIYLIFIQKSSQQSISGFCSVLLSTYSIKFIAFKVRLNQLSNSGVGGQVQKKSMSNRICIEKSKKKLRRNQTQNNKELTDKAKKQEKQEKSNRFKKATNRCMMLKQKDKLSNENQEKMKLNKKAPHLLLHYYIELEIELISKSQQNMIGCNLSKVNKRKQHQSISEDAVKILKNLDDEQNKRARKSKRNRKCKKRKNKKILIDKITCNYHSNVILILLFIISFKINFFSSMQSNETTNMNVQSEENTNDHVKNTRMFQKLLNIQQYFSYKPSRDDSEDKYNVFSIIDKNDPDRIKFTSALKAIFKEVEEKKKQISYNLFSFDKNIERAVACFLGLAIGDALGSTTQFCSYDKKRTEFIQYDFKDLIKRAKDQGYDRQGKVNIWTDDCSMALSLADSLLLNNFNLNPKHSRFMYHMWLHHGLNNGGRRYSIGLGGNISISTGQFKEKQTDFTQEGNKFNNGNGSLMRLAPIPVAFWKDQQKGMDAAQNQSRTTHNGIQAKQCCRLLTLIIIRLINRGKNDDWRKVIEKACTDFKTNSKSVKCLALSQQQSKQLYDEQSKQFKNFALYNKKLYDRNWDWKDKDYTYSPSRADNMPGYVGSYCMDALSMALHTVWHSKSYHEVAILNCNMGGDCDTVGAIAGQIAGAVYGIDSEMLHLYSQMEDSISGRFEVFLKAYKLATHRSIYP